MKNSGKVSKGLAIFLATASLMGLAACGNGSSSSSPRGPTASARKPSNPEKASGTREDQSTASSRSKANQDRQRADEADQQHGADLFGKTVSRPSS